MSIEENETMDAVKASADIQEVQEIFVAKEAEISKIKSGRSA